MEEELKLSTDLVIVDECSMVSMQLLYALLKAMDKGTRLVLIGDCDQLPSVQAGNVFSDLIGKPGVSGYLFNKNLPAETGGAILTKCKAASTADRADFYGTQTVCSARPGRKRIHWTVCSR